ncbi:MULTISPECIES: PIN domain-containing protein [unclassified Frankia]|uniref:PIN domain-containing protein n=1 Tax=unclassified Frankia TaxID=2632575 RepID=UPI0019331578|nr:MULTISPECIES: PIN domain-containing protein [unclassified Frankia]MBL7620609.1 PIN domain-containing protein [Frankia sp. AgB1.8]
MIVAVLDANVLIPNALCDLLLRLAEEQVFVPRWSAHILDEVARNLPAQSRSAAERRIRYMTEAFHGAAVSGYEHLIPTMANDVKDRHVLAAAVAGDADLIVTCDLKDFPSESCEKYAVEIEHPDAFLLGVLDRDQTLVLGVLHDQAASTGRRGPRLSVPDVLQYVARAGARRFADEIGAMLPANLRVEALAGSVLTARIEARDPAQAG